MTPRLSPGTNHCSKCLNAMDDHDGWLTVSKYPNDAFDPETLTCPPKRQTLPATWSTT